VSSIDASASLAPLVAFVGPSLPADEARRGDLLNLARSGGAVRGPQEWEELAARSGLRIASRRPLAPFVHLRLHPVEP
jgi:hypothetical protein